MNALSWIIALQILMLQVSSASYNSKITITGHSGIVLIELGDNLRAV